MTYNKGYTLLEVLIALAVFAILAVITSTALYRAFSTRAHVTAQAIRLNELQLALIIVERDINQVIVRSIQTNNQQVISPFVGQSGYTEFSRGGLVNPNSAERRSTIQRVALQCRGNKLIRRTWATLDTPNRNKYDDSILLNDTACKFAYVNRNHDVFNEWHESTTDGDSEELDSLPSAIKLTLHFPDWGEMSMLFVIPQGLYG